MVLFGVKKEGVRKYFILLKNEKSEKWKERRYNYVKRIILFGCIGSVLLLRVIVFGIDWFVNLMYYFGVK